MRKNYFFACAAAALMLASCQKEAPVSDASSKQEGTTPDAPTADMSVITATTSNTKVTTLDGVNVLWDKGDKIQLYTRTWNEGTSKFDAGWCDYNSSIEEPSATATFVRDEANTNTVDNTSGRYVAVYYKGASAVTVSRDYYAQIAINKEQVAKNGGDFVSTLLYAGSEDAEFTFSHAASYIKFTVDQNTTPFTKLSIVPKNESEYIVTRIKIDFTNDDVTSTPLPLNDSNKPYSQSSRIVTITTDDEEAFAPGTYYIAINPGTYANGFELTFENGSEVSTIDTPKENVVIAAGQVANLGTIGTLQFEVPPTPLEVATVYTENNKPQGVIYWVDPANPYKGKAISVSTPEPIQWSKELIWTDKINSQASGLDNLAQFEASPVYTDRKDDYYALKYCADMRANLGGNWYLPANDELRLVYQVYYGMSAYPSTVKKDYRTDNLTNAMAAKSKYDAALRLLGETTTATLDGDADGDGVSDNDGFGTADGVTYWLSKVNTGGAAQYITIGKYNNGHNSKDMANTKYYVRCIRDVEIK